jgi:ABC-type multidrug transport system ATPase subunit
MLDPETIHSLVEQRLQTECFSANAHDDDDSGVRDYVLQVLQDEDSYDDPEQLVETLQSFLCNATDEPQPVQALIDALLAACRGGINGSAFESPPALTAVPLPLVSSPLGNHPKQGSDEEKEQGDSMASNRKGHASKRRQRKREAKTRSQNAASTPSSTVPNNESIFLEDDASAWQDCREQRTVWGGRGRGGRGEYAAAVNSIQSNIHLSGMTLTNPAADLLQNATMDIVRGHRYGLIGRNGVGKTSLLQRLVSKTIPGIPADMRIMSVQQQIDGSDESALQTLVKSDTDRAMLIQEQEAVEDRMQDDAIMEEESMRIAERLEGIVGEMDAISADTAEQRALEILMGLQFATEMINGPTHNLPGGWRMRLALAKALFVTSDLMLFDECTNHLDLHGLDWLIQFLNKNTDRTLIVVSHDRAFLDDICTDIVVMENQKLKYHVGNYSEYDRQQEEKTSRESQILDAADRQRTKAQAFIQKQQAAANKKSADPNKQR